MVSSIFTSVYDILLAEPGYRGPVYEQVQSPDVIVLGHRYCSVVVNALSSSRCCASRHNCRKCSAFLY